MAQRPHAILIAGPTASGKSSLAVKLAQRHGGIVVNADSMQVYREIPILTAQPDADSMAGIGHHLFGHVPARNAYSVALWLRDVATILKQAHAADTVPVFVGGTGLYFKALEEGLSDIPDPTPEVREYWRRRAAEASEILHGELAVRDPAEAARLPLGDTGRIVRALEIIDSTGKPISHFRRKRQPSPIAGLETMRINIQPSAAQLRQRIADRFDRMIAEGAMHEVERLAAQELNPDLPAMKAIGVPQLLMHVKGDQTLQEAVDAAKIASNQYAKRQRTWFRNQLGPGWIPAAP